MEGETHRQASPPLCLENRHRCQTARSHGDVWQFVGRTMGRDREQIRSGVVHAAQDEGRADMTVIPEEHLFEHCHGRHDPWLASG